MREISISSILMQFIKHKKGFSLIILACVLLGAIYGFINEINNQKNAATIVVDKEDLNSSIEELSLLLDEQTHMLEHDIYLNMNPELVPTSIYTVFIDTTDSLSPNQNNIGYFYSRHRLTESDYSAIKKIIGNSKLENREIDNLISQTYSSDTNLLHLYTIFPDLDIAEKLGDYNYNRILKLRDTSDEGYDLRLLDKELVVRKDDGLRKEIENRNTLLVNIQNQIDTLNKARNTSSPNSLNLSSLLKSMIKWGMLSLFGALALTSIVAAGFAGTNQEFDETIEMENYIQANILGFIPSSNPKLFDRMMINKEFKRLGFTEILNQIFVETKRNNSTNIVVIDYSKEPTVYNLLEKELSNKTMNRIVNLSIPELEALKPEDTILFVAPLKTGKQVLKQQINTVKHLGNEVVGVIFTNYIA